VAVNHHTASTTARNCCGEVEVCCVGITRGKPGEDWELEIDQGRVDDLMNGQEKIWQTSGSRTIVLVE